MYMKMAGWSFLAYLILIAIAQAFDAGSLLWLGYWSNHVHSKKAPTNETVFVSNEKGVTILGILYAHQSTICLNLLHRTCKKFDFSYIHNWLLDMRHIL